MSLVRLEGVTKQVTLPDESTLDILRGVDLAVSAGDHVAIVGRSGSGKSTLLNILGLLDLPTSGTAEFRGTPVAGIRRGRLDRMRGRDVGFVFQQFHLLAGRTALENVEMPLGYASGKQFWRRRELARAMLDRVGLAHRLDTPPERLSGGEQQRVAIARAIAPRPALIFADEPTGNLDAATGHEIVELLFARRAETGATLLVITHDPELAQHCERVLTLADGRITSDTAA
ncbi:MAG TPA: ABC transporter ATP-binding protein [Microbacterium sp.]|nr:ABC transporter ATP-binding protein [Microbacterium sp.]